MLDPSLNIAVFSVPRTETVINVTMSYYESPPTHYINGIQPVHWVRLVRHVYDVILFIVFFASTSLQRTTKQRNAINTDEICQS